MEDSFFGRSPFTSGPLITLQFRHGDHLNVHRALLLRHPKLLALVSHQFSGISSQPPPGVARLKHISRSAGHVLVHYLYTNTYGTLNWVGPANGREERVAKLKTGFEIYATARKYELGGLEDLAKEQISLLSKELDAFTTVAAVSEVYPTSTGEDTWFSNFMKTVVKTAFEGSAALLEPEARKPVGGGLQGTFPTAVILLRSALEAYREMARDGSAEAEPAQPTDDNCEWGTTAWKEKRKGGYYTYCTWDAAQELVKLPALMEDAAPEEALPEETAAEPAPAMETSAEEAPWEEPYLKEAYPQEACAEEVPIAAEAPHEETRAIEETAWPARLDPVPDNIFGSFNPSNMKKGKGKEKKRRTHAVYREPYVEDGPEDPKPTHEPEEKSGAAYRNATDSGFFSRGSATSFEFSFRPTDKATIDDTPSTANSVFTPTTEQESSF